MTRLTIWLRKENVFEGPQVFARSTAAILSLQFAPQLLEEQRPERVEKSPTPHLEPPKYPATYFQPDSLNWRLSVQIWERGSAGQPLPCTTGQHSPPSALLSKVEHYNPMRHTGRVLIADRTCCCFLVLAAHKLQCSTQAVQQVLLGQRHFLHFPESQCWHLFPSHLQRRPFHTCHYVLGTRHLQNHPKEFKFR